MILAFIIVIGFVVIAASAAKFDWWAVAMAVGILFVLFGLSCAERTDAKAYNNRQRYWANGGPEGNRRR